MNAMPRLVPGALLVLVLTAACGAPSGSSDPGAGIDTPAESPDAPVGCYDPGAPPEDPGGLSPCPDLAPTEGPQRLEPRGDLVDVAPHPWERAEAGDDGRSLDIVFWGGVEDCYGVDRVEVDEGRRRVVVTLYTGRVPSAEVCIELAVEQYVEVRLEDPVGDRRIVDGASAEH